VSEKVVAKAVERVVIKGGQIKIDNSFYFSEKLVSKGGSIGDFFQMEGRNYFLIHGDLILLEDTCFQGNNIEKRESLKKKKFKKAKKKFFKHREEVQKILNDVSLALASTHNTVTTDVPELCVEDDLHWRIDHKEEIEALTKLGKILAKSNCIDL